MNESKMQGSRTQGSRTQANRLHRTDLTIGQQRAVLAGAVFRNDKKRGNPASGPSGGRSRLPVPVNGEQPLDELAALTETAGAQVVGRLLQRLQNPHPGTYLGRGKLEELRSLVEHVEAHVVIFDNELQGAQIKRIEQVVGCSILDRSELILAIFASRARTRQSRIQVELAQLKYMLPRLRRMWTHLERQAGGIGLRAGMGERQIEVDRRRMRGRITDLSRQLKVIAARTERTLQARTESFNVSLVGYTNAGKSTLLNALTGAGAFVEDRLFATLDTKTRAMRLEGGHRVLLSDTIGFIRHLPHHLVASFHATLAETLTADLLIHVVDAAHPGHEAQIRVVNEVLASIDAARIPTIVAFNKIDRLDGPGQADLRLLRERFPGSVALSAFTGEGLEQLRHEILAASSRGTQEVTLSVPTADGAALSYLARHAFVLKRSYETRWVRMRMLIDPGHLEKVLGRHPNVKVNSRESP